MVNSYVGSLTPLVPFYTSVVSEMPGFCWARLGQGFAYPITADTWRRLGDAAPRRERSSPGRRHALWYSPPVSTLPRLLRTSIALLVACAAVLTVVARTEDRRAGPAVRFAPDASAPGAPRIEGEAFAVETPAFVARLEQLDDARRRAYLEDRAGTATDPFASRPDAAPSFLTFLLEIENRSAGTLVFEPLTCRLVLPGNDFRNPLDLATIQSAYGVLEREMPRAYLAAGQALFAGDAFLEPNERRSGLLVYQAPAPRTKAFFLEIQLTLPSGESVGFKAPYRRVKR